jgi:hypothetical protein
MRAADLRRAVEEYPVPLGRRPMIAWILSFTAA